MEIFVGITIATAIVWFIIERYRNPRRLNERARIESLNREAAERNPHLPPADQMNALYRCRFREIVVLRKAGKHTDELEGDLWRILNEISRLTMLEVEEMSGIHSRQFNEAKDVDPHATNGGRQTLEAYVGAKEVAL